jgi:MFS transporter, PAT family, solute carrier family 33 (acetyl-CoA transportor), member 1
LTDIICIVVFLRNFRSALSESIKNTRLSQLCFRFCSQGVSKQNLALVNIPVTLIAIVAPMVIRHTKLPLIWFAGSYVLCLITAIPVAAVVYFTPQMLTTNYYYPLLIFLLALNEFAMVLRFAAQIGFFASISDPRIGGTYMTFLVTIYNLGFALHSSIVLYVAEWLPKHYAYILAVGLCITVGCIWFAFSYRILQQLQQLPTQQWYLVSERTTANSPSLEQRSQNDFELSLMANNEENSIKKI